jgi:hypothetical protein
MSHELGLGSPAEISQAGAPSCGFERKAENGNNKKLKSAAAQVCPRPIAATKKDAFYTAIEAVRKTDRPSMTADFCEKMGACFYTLFW